MKKKILILSMAFALFSAFAFQAYAIGCPSECKDIGYQQSTGWCADAEGPEGSESCETSGTGGKDCTGTYTPTACTPV